MTGWLSAFLYNLLSKEKVRGIYINGDDWEWGSLWGEAVIEKNLGPMIFRPRVKQGFMIG